MTNNDEPKIKLPKTHPHLAKLVIDPADWHEFERQFEDRPEVKIRKLGTSEPDQWTVWVGCASEMVKHLLEENW
ncbi:MAG TPA: hypothetical protein VMU82_04475 [Acetobacteraceae bacterium]|nr:hypothetical protein [Acetobacteraceae bacterium]